MGMRRPGRGDGRRTRPTYPETAKAALCQEFELPHEEGGRFFILGITAPGSRAAVGRKPRHPERCSRTCARRAAVARAPASPAPAPVTAERTGRRASPGLRPDAANRAAVRAGLREPRPFPPHPAVSASRSLSAGGGRGGRDAGPLCAAPPEPPHALGTSVRFGPAPAAPARQAETECRWVLFSFQHHFPLPHGFHPR